MYENSAKCILELLRSYFPGVSNTISVKTTHNCEHDEFVNFNQFGNCVTFSERISITLLVHTVF